MSPPLPLTASTRTGCPVNGSGSSIFELVLPPPKFVMRRSAPSKFERYRKRDNGLPSSARACSSLHKSFKQVVPLTSSISHLAVVFESLKMMFPLVGFCGLDNLSRERTVNYVANLFQRRCFASP